MRSQITGEDRGMNFNCTHCQQSLEADETIAGREIQCPACGRFITVPEMSPAPPPVAPTEAPAAMLTGQSTDQESGNQDVTVTDVRIPFWSMVVLFIKASLAAIPAMIVLAVIYFVVFVLMIGGCAGLMMGGASL